MVLVEGRSGGGASAGGGAVADGGAAEGRGCGGDGGRAGGSVWASDGARSGGRDDCGYVVVIFVVMVDGSGCWSEMQVMGIVGRGNDVHRKGSNGDAGVSGNSGENSGDERRVVVVIMVAELEVMVGVIEERKERGALAGGGRGVGGC